MKTETQTIKPLDPDPTFDWSRCLCGERFQTTAELDRHYDSRHGRPARDFNARLAAAKAAVADRKATAAAREAR